MPIDQPKTAAELINNVIPSITTNIQLADDTGSLGSTAFHVDQKHKYPYVVITGLLDLVETILENLCPSGLRSPTQVRVAISLREFKSRRNQKKSFFLLIKS